MPYWISATWSPPTPDAIVAPSCARFRRSCTTCPTISRPRSPGTGPPLELPLDESLPNTTLETPRSPRFRQRAAAVVIWRRSVAPCMLCHTPTVDPRLCSVPIDSARVFTGTPQVQFRSSSGCRSCRKDSAPDRDATISRRNENGIADWTASDLPTRCATASPAKSRPVCDPMPSYMQAAASWA